MARPWEVSADDIDAWARTAAAAVTLPKLVRRLLFATAPLRSLVMRADAGIHLSGWDGVVESTRDTTFCPAGTSYWELSVDAKVKSKLDRDFQKRIGSRTADAAATYVAVTARRFSGKDDWVEEKQRQGPFAGVAVLDADDLAAWLEQSPPVARWFASMLELPAAGGEDLETFLALWERRTVPPLPAGLVLAGREREEAASRVRSWLTAPAPRPLAVRGDTREEVLVFVAAAMTSPASTESEQWQSRALVVKDLETWKWLTGSQHAEPPILLPAFQEIDRGHVEHAARSIKAHVLWPLDAGASTDIEAELLEAIPYPQVADQLRRAGIAEVEAERLARESGGRLAALRRLLGHSTMPDWVVPADLPPLLAMLLAGAWDPASEADRKVIGRLGGDPRTVEELCARLSRRADAPIEREVSFGRRGHWRWVAPADAWRALARHLSDSHLTSFRDVAIEVLGERDPRYEMPKGERLYAAVQGKVLGRSGALRGGIAESLVRLALSDPELRASFQTSRGSETASIVVSRVLDEEGGWQVWASLSELLPVLAEAAPSTFLSRVEQSLDRGPAGVAHLLQEEEARGRNPHTGLLWALEALAWNPEFLARVAYALARLAMHDPPEAKTANRPLSSLLNLLHPLMPQSKSTVEERNQILSVLMSQQAGSGDVGWRAALALYRGMHGQGFLFPSHRPRYQPWELPPEHYESTHADIVGQLSATLELLLTHVGSRPERWKDLLESLWRFSEGAVGSILERLGQTMNIAADPHGIVWASLRHLLSDGHNFGQAWNIPAANIERIEKFYRDFTPADLIGRITWLFEGRSELPEPIEDWDAQQSRRQQLRREAIAELWGTERRWELLARLIEAVEQKWEIGIALAEIDSAEIDERLLKGSADEQLSPIIPAFVWKRAQTSGMEWASRIIRDLVGSGREPDALAIALARSPDPALWDVIDSIGDPLREKFWSSVRLILGDHSEEEAARALHSLMAAGNVAVAARYAAHKTDITKPSAALDILDVLRRSEATHLEVLLRGGGAGYVIERMFDIVDRDTDLDSSMIISFEIYFLPLLENTKRGARRLSSALNTEPAWFVSLLVAAYRADNDFEVESGARGASHSDPAAADGEIPDPVEVQLRQRRALTALHILHGWRGCPGSDLQPAEQESKLLDWAREALQLSAEQHRKAIGEIEVAKVLARAPGALDDGVWPCRAARELLETGLHGNLENGLFTAKLNLRGGTARAIGEGGKQERALAAGFRADAKKLRIRWGRTAGLLDQLAESYERSAEEKDAEAKAERRRFGDGSPEIAINGEVSAEVQSPEPVTFDRIEALSLEGVGPAPSLEVPLAERLTLLTGQNSAGKTFVLDVLWWGLTGTWADLFAWPRRESSGAPQPTIALALPDGRSVACHYSATDEEWKRPPDLGSVQALVVYCRVDGGFAIWDPIRSRETGGGRRSQPKRSAFCFTPQTLWDGLKTDDGRVICNGIIRDVVDWGARRQELSSLLDRVLGALSDPDDPMRLAEPVRLSIGDARDFPTLRMPYGDVPLVHASAAVKRIFGLGYLLVWAWHEHREAARLAGIDSSGQMVVLFDEPEAHLHPIWQRRVIPALFEAVKALSESMPVQIIASTHSPLVTASLEPIFNPSIDKLLHFQVDEGEKIARVRELPWSKQGDASDWLMSEAFGLTHARSTEAEQAIEAAMDFARNGPSSELRSREDVVARLRKVMPGDDPFLVRWLFDPESVR